MAALIYQPLPSPGESRTFSWALGGSLLAHALVLGAALAWRGQPPALKPIPVIEVALGQAPAGAVEPARGAPETHPIHRAPQKTVAPAHLARSSSPPAPARRAPVPSPALIHAGTSPQGTVAAPNPGPTAQAEPSHGAPLADSGERGGSSGDSGLGATTPGSGGKTQQPYALSAPVPPYPPLARREGTEGKVKLKVLISEEGRVNGVSLFRSSGSPLLDQAALETLEKWRFSPAMENGRRVAAWVVVPVVFSLH